MSIERDCMNMAGLESGSIKGTAGICGTGVVGGLEGRSLGCRDLEAID